MIADSIITRTKRSNTENCMFSILIPSWNNLPYLQNCINSIRKNSFYPHQVIVHINEGNDGSLEWIKEQADVDHTYSSTNIGICYALNLARGLADTDYIVYMNDDMYACANWDKYLMDEINTIGHPYFFLSSTAIEPFPGNNCTVFQNFGNDIHSFNEKKLLEEYAQVPLHDWQGATWPPNVVHISVWDMVGGYSVEFSPGFYSDPDFSMKLWHAGIRLFKGVSKSRAYHFGSKSTKRIRKNKNYYIFLKKWGITASTLTKYYLHRGEVFTGPLVEEKIPMSVRIKKPISPA